MAHLLKQGDHGGAGATGFWHATKLKAKGHLFRLVSLTPQKAIAITSLPVPATVRFVLARHLDRFGYQRSAKAALKAIPLTRYPARLQTRAALIIGGMGPDDDVEQLMADICDRVCDAPEAGVWRELLSWYSDYSTLPDADRFAAIERLAALHFPNGGSAFRRDVAISKARVAVRQSANIHFDILELLPAFPEDPKRLAQLYPFVKPLRICGYSAEATEILTALKTVDRKRYLHEMLRNFPGLVDSSEIQVPKNAKEQVNLLFAMFSMAGLSAEHRGIFQDIISAIQASFPDERLKNRHRILKLLTKLGLQEEAIECLNRADNPKNETLMSARSLRAWERYYAYDFSGAASEFEKVVLEAPKQPDALDGFRFSLARCGKSMSEIYDRIVDLVGTPRVDSEANVWRHFEQGSFDELGRHYRKGSRWKALDEYLGQRMIRTWPSDVRPDKSLLFIADQGVGDEIRQYRFYKELTRVFGTVHATCDPRLKQLLEFNFPEMTFHPVWRTRLGLTDRVHRIDNRIKGFSGALYNILSEDIRPLLDSVDYVANHFSLIAAEAEENLKLPTKIAAITSPQVETCKKGGKRLRVGVVWRSSLFRGARRLMYLSVEALEPLVKIDGVEFHCIQHGLTPEEKAFCDANGLVVRQDIDLYDDFDAMAAYISSMDLVIGISTVPAELAAALGVPVWFMGFSPENLNLRTLGGTTEQDQLTPNAIVIGPKNRDFNRPPQECIADTVNVVCERLRKETQG